MERRAKNQGPKDPDFPWAGILDEFDTLIGNPEFKRGNGRYREHVDAIRHALVYHPVNKTMSRGVRDHLIQTYKFLGQISPLTSSPEALRKLTEAADDMLNKDAESGWIDKEQPAKILDPSLSGSEVRPPLAQAHADIRAALRLTALHLAIESEKATPENIAPGRTELDRIRIRIKYFYKGWPGQQARLLEDAQVIESKLNDLQAPKKTGNGSSDVNAMLFAGSQARAAEAAQTAQSFGGHFVHDPFHWTIVLGLSFGVFVLIWLWHRLPRGLRREPKSSVLRATLFSTVFFVLTLLSGARYENLLVTRPPAPPASTEAKASGPTASATPASPTLSPTPSVPLAGPAKEAAPAAQPRDIVLPPEPRPAAPLATTAAGREISLVDPGTPAHEMSDRELRYEQYFADISKFQFFVVKIVPTDPKRTLAGEAFDLVFDDGTTMTREISSIIQESPTLNLYVVDVPPALPTQGATLRVYTGRMYHSLTLNPQGDVKSTVEAQGFNWVKKSTANFWNPMSWIGLSVAFFGFRSKRQPRRSSLAALATAA